MLTQVCIYYPLRVIWCVALAYILSIHTLSAQEKQYTVEYIGGKSALKDSYIWATRQSQLGPLWIGTANGLYRFDGINTLSLNSAANSTPRLSGDFVNGLAEDAQNRLWISTDHGLNILDPYTLDLIPPEQIPFPTPSLHKEIIGVCQGQGTSIFFCTTSTIYEYKENNISIYSTPSLSIKPTSFFIFSQKTNTHYFLSGKNLICNLKDGIASYSNYSVSLKNSAYIKPEPINRYWVVLLNDIADSCLLTIAPGYILQVKKHKDSYWYQSDDPYELAKKFRPWGAVLNYIEKDSLFSKSLKHSFRLQTVERLDSFTWALGTSRGIYLVRESITSFKHIKTTQGQSVRGITRDSRGHLLVGTYNGLIEYDGNKAKLYNDNTLHFIWDFFPAGIDTFWGVTETFEGLRKIIWNKNKGYYAETPPFAENIAFCKSMARSPNGFWTGNLSGNLFHINTSTGACTPSMFNIKSIYEQKVKIIISSPNGYLWCGGEAGLQEYLLNKDGEIIEKTSLNKLPPVLQSTSINALYEDINGNLWIGSANAGLFKYTPGSKNTLQNWTISDGLSHNTVYSILSSHSDSILWIGTQNGLCRFIIQQNDFHTFYAANGLQQNEFNTGARYKSPDNILYFGGINGVSYFNPDWIPDFREKYTPYLQLSITDPTNQTQRLIQPQNGHTVVIQPDEVLLEFIFRSKEIFQASELICRYKIKDINKEWRIINLAEKLTLAGLKSGDYILEYQIKSPDSGWSELKSLNIKILPPWYLRPWAIALGLVIIALLLYLLYRWRISELRREFEFRKSVTDDLHDSLGSRLYLLKALASKIVHQDKGIDLLPTFEHQAMDALQIIRNFIWAFDPQHDDLNALCSRMNDFADNYLRPIVPKVHFKIRILHPECKISPHLKHNLLNIYQELLTNIVKHTNSEYIDIQLINTDNFLDIILVNTHNGFKGSLVDISEKLHIGKTSIEHRLLSISSKMEWVEIDGSEQKIKIIVPLKNKI